MLFCTASLPHLTLQTRSEGAAQAFDIATCAGSLCVSRDRPGGFMVNSQRYDQTFQICLLSPATETKLTIPSGGMENSADFVPREPAGFGLRSSSRVRKSLVGRHLRPELRRNSDAREKKKHKMRTTVGRMGMQKG